MYFTSTFNKIRAVSRVLQTEEHAVGPQGLALQAVHHQYKLSTSSPNYSVIPHPISRSASAVFNCKPLNTLMTVDYRQKFSEMTSLACGDIFFQFFFLYRDSKDISVLKACISLSYILRSKRQVSLDICIFSKMVSTASKTKAGSLSTCTGCYSCWSARENQRTKTSVSPRAGFSLTCRARHFQPSSYRHTHPEHYSAG